jgi:superfamily II DNA or RNA helicase
MITRTCRLIIKDQCNATFEGLDPAIRRKCSNKLKFFIHAAKHTPAYKLGRWDGCVSFFAINGNTFVHLLDQVLDIIIDAGYEIELVDNRQDNDFQFEEVTDSYLADNVPGLVWPPGHVKSGEPILLRDYQVDVVHCALDNLQSVLVLSTGSGKTIVCATLSHLCQGYGRTLVIVPNKDLVRQTEADYRNVGLDVGVWYGDRKEAGHRHTISTWQSLSRVANGEAQISLAEFIDDVICVICDECHQAQANVLKQLLTGPLAHIPIRWGLSGTVPTEEPIASSILASLGPTVKKLPARELMDIGVLAQCHVHVMQMQDTVEYRSYAEEYNYLVTDQTRLDWMAGVISERGKEGNTLVLINRIETGKELHARVPGSIFLSGQTKMESRNDAYVDMSTSDNKVIIATYGIAAVGINIPRIFNLVIVEPGKSFVRVIQSIGRSIRIAKDKSYVDIFDIASTCKFSARHLSARKKIYRVC